MKQKAPSGAQEENEIMKNGSSGRKHRRRERNGTIGAGPEASHEDAQRTGARLLVKKKG